LINGFELHQPDWAVAALAEIPEFVPSLDARMRWVIRFSELNIDHETGGPFAAGVFESETGRLVTIGVNRVMASNCSSAHAEVMALSLAQQSIGHFDLGSSDAEIGGQSYQLVVNWRPCAMCYGALIWSGVRSLVIAGSGPELEEITGFDEGPIHPEWRQELLKRGISVTDNVLTAEAISVYEKFRRKGAYVYNGRTGTGRDSGGI
jgi:tRNA(Arg) A34 adenosine deaminase TadA